VTIFDTSGYLGALFPDCPEDLQGEKTGFGGTEEGLINGRGNPPFVHFFPQFNAFSGNATLTFFPRVGVCWKEVPPENYPSLFRIALFTDLTLLAQFPREETKFPGCGIWRFTSRNCNPHLFGPQKGKAAFVNVSFVFHAPGGFGLRRPRQLIVSRVEVCLAPRFLCLTSTRLQACCPHNLGGLFHAATIVKTLLSRTVFSTAFWVGGDVNPPPVYCAQHSLLWGMFSPPVGV